MPRAAKGPRTRGAGPKKSSGRSSTGRAKATKRGKAGTKRRKSAGKARRSASTGPSNRRVDPRRHDASPRARLEPEERKARNRTYLLIAVLVLVNLYVLVWRDRGSLADFDLKSTALAGESQGIFTAPANACGVDPVRIFEHSTRLWIQRTRLSEGRTLRLALLGVGVPGAQIDEVEGAVRGKMDLGLLAGSGADLRVATDPTGTVHALEVELSEGHVVQACRDASGLIVRNLQHPLRVDVAVIALELGPDGLASAVENSDESPELGPLVAQTLAFDVDFHTESRPGDKVQLLVEKRYLGAHFHRYGRVLAVRYIGAAGRIGYYKYKVEGRSSAFFDHTGAPMRRELLRSPVAWYPVDRSARGELAPRVEFVEGRMGATYRREAGTPVLAMGDGEIVALRRNGEDGLTLELKVDDRVVRYSHLERIVGELSVGQRVKQGQVVGLVGATGRAPRPRLRLEIFEGDRAIDPMFVHDRGDGRPARLGAAMPSSFKERFAKDVQPWRKSLRQAGR